MNREEELFAALQSAHFAEIVDDGELARRSRTTARRIRHKNRRDRWREGHRWWVAGVAGVVALFAGVGAASAGLQHRQPEHQDLVWCYRYLPENLTDDDARFGVLSIAAQQTTAENAVDLCSTNADGTRSPIPHPVSQCVLHDGNVGVLPIARCVDLGLPESDLGRPPR